MARVLAISSQTVFGPVGNSAATPALQAKGHEVLQLPTVILSNHPGHGRPAGAATPASLLQEILTTLASLGALHSCTAVMTGYFAAPEQVEVASLAINTMRAAHPDLLVLVDPVIGDGDALYVPDAVACAIRDLLMPLASIATPNAFELSWLAGTVVNDSASAVAAARQIAAAEMILTSIPGADNGLETILVVPRMERYHRTTRRAQVPHGTGDFLAGAYLAERLVQQAGPAFDAAMQRLDKVIAASSGGSVLLPLA